MTKKTKIILAILVAMIIWLVGYAIASHQKVNAQQEIIDKQQPIIDTVWRIDELDRLIEMSQNDYNEYLKAKVECQAHRDEKMNEAHEKADWFRQEQEELMGFLLNR